MAGDWNRISAASEANKEPILAELRKVIPEEARVLEIGSGAGQHAFHFSSALPGIYWQPSDLEVGLEFLKERVAQSGLANVAEPIVVDIAHWPNLRPAYDAVYSANCLHIAPAGLMPSYVAGAARSLKQGGKLLLYGPWKYDGKFTTESNEKFDRFLSDTYPGGGIRDFSDLSELAAAEGLVFVSDTPMPANNQFLVFQKA